MHKKTSTHLFTNYVTQIMQAPMQSHFLTKLDLCQKQLFDVRNATENQTKLQKAYFSRLSFEEDHYLHKLDKIR